MAPRSSGGRARPSLCGRKESGRRSAAGRQKILSCQRSLVVRRWSPSRTIEHRVATCASVSLSSGCAACKHVAAPAPPCIITVSINKYCHCPYKHKLTHRSALEWLDPPAAGCPSPRMRSHSWRVPPARRRICRTGSECSSRRRLRTGFRRRAGSSWSTAAGKRSVSILGWISGFWSKAAF